MCGKPQPSPRSPQEDPALLSVLSHGHHRERRLDPGAGSSGSALAQVLSLQESPDLSPDLSKCNSTGPFFSYRHVSCPQGAYRLHFLSSSLFEGKSWVLLCVLCKDTSPWVLVELTWSLNLREVLNKHLK